MGKHTAGPWKLSEKCSDAIIADGKYANPAGSSGHDDVEYYGGVLIAESVQQRNRTLIAVAPEMLEKLLWFARYHSFPDFAHKEECAATEATGGDLTAMDAHIIELDLLFERLGVELNPNPTQYGNKGAQS